MTTRHATTGEHLAHHCHASRKDLRDAIVAARAALPGWSGTTAYLRGQILYRAAEMIEGRAESFANEIAAVTGARPAEARCEVAAAVDILVHPRWLDRQTRQVFGSVNPVASPHFNFTFPEPCGVVGVFAPDQPSLLGLTTLLARVILSGNTCVALASETAPLPALSLAEALATSDLPGGVINLLTGHRAELAPWLASHLDVNAVLDASGDPEILKTLQGGAEATSSGSTIIPCPLPKPGSAKPPAIPTGPRHGRVQDRVASHGRVTRETGAPHRPRLRWHRSRARCGGLRG